MENGFPPNACKMNWFDHLDKFTEYFKGKQQHILNDMFALVQNLKSKY